MKMRPALSVLFLLSQLASPTLKATQDRAVGITWTPMTFETREGAKRSVAAESGTLIVAEDWARPQGRTITLKMVRFKATTSTPRSPIVYLAGGPGGSGILSASGDRFPLFMKLRESADVIALDQRGVRSDPFPSCPGTIQLPLDQPASADAWMPVMRAASRTCVEKWTSNGVDLANFDAVASAHDLDALRRALGAPQLNLLGISYGTHLALATLRQHPTLAERVVLAGVEGPDDTLKLPSAADAHLNAVAGVIDPELAKRGQAPLMSLFDTVAKRLRTPVTVTTNVRGKDVTVTLGLSDLQMAILELSSERHDIEEFPKQIIKAAGGDLRDLAAWAVSRRTLPGLLPMAFVNDCASGASPERLARIAQERAMSLMGDAFNLPFPGICDVWPHRDLGADFRGPVQSTVPTLFISGSLDGRTPVANARAVMRGFQNGRELLLDPAGHDDDLLIATPEIGQIIAAFFAGRAPEATRLDLSPLKFVR